MYCTHCGKELSDLAAICVGCGKPVKNLKTSANDSNSVGWWFLGFFFPLVGLVLWLVWTGNYPLKAKKLGWGTLIGFIVSAVLVALFYIVYFALILLFEIGISQSLLF